MSYRSIASIYKLESDKKELCVVDIESAETSPTTSWSSDMTVHIGIPLLEPGPNASICLECRTDVYAAN